MTREETKRLEYKKWMFMYGIHTIIFVLEHFELNENYEECQIIMDSIKEQEDRLDIELCSRVSEGSIKHTKEVYRKYNLTGKYMIENSKHYASIIIKETEKN